MKKCFTICLALLLFFTTTGCGDEYQAGKSFTYILPQSITSLDPQTAKSSSERALVSMIFEGLCRLNSAGEVVGAAAESWEANESNTQFTFHLRSNLRWVDGTVLTAQDFVFGVQRALDPVTGATGIENMLLIVNARAVMKGEMAPEQLGVSAPDDRTVVFQLETAFSDFPRLTAESRFMPCNRQYFEESGGHYGLDSSYTLTNGPLTFTSIYAWKQDKSIELSKTTQYGGGQKALPGKIMLIMPGTSEVPQDMFEALLQGNIDLLQITQEELPVAGEKGCEVITLNNAVLGLLLNTQDKYLKEVDLRQIYMQTIDRQKVVSRLTEGTQEALGIFPPSVKWEGGTFQELSDPAYPSKDSSVIDNMESVLSRLELNSLPSITILCPDDDLSKNLATGIIIAWNDILPNAFNMEPLPYDQYLSRLESGNYQAALYSISAGAQPASVLQQFISGAVPQLLDSEVYDKSLQEVQFDKASFRQLEQDLMDQYVFYPIHYDHNYYALSPQSKGIFVTPDLGVNFVEALKKG